MRRASTKLVPRLQVLWRPETPRAVIVRRGPTSVSATFGWDLDTDELTPGQMMRAQMYPRTSDISGDGVWLYYTAYDARAYAEPTEGTYACVSRAPYLKAVKYYPGAYRGSARLFRAPVGDAPFSLRNGSYQKRLERDGWRAVADGVLHRPIARGCTLEKALDGDGERHRILARRDQARPLDCDWADVRGDRLIWTRGGLVQASRAIDRDGCLQQVDTVHDLGDCRFVRRRAPY